MITHFNITKECFDTLVRIFETKASSQKRLLKNQLCTLKMEKDDSLNFFFMKISQIRYHLLDIEINVNDDDLVQTFVDGIYLSWEAFLVVVNGCDVYPNFNRLWQNCLQEEGRVCNRNGPSQEEILLSMQEQRNENKRGSPIKRTREKRNFKGN